MAPRLTIVPAGAVAPALLHRTFVDAFADYLIGPFDVGLDAWPAFLARQCVDLGPSRVVLDGSMPLAFALVAPRPRRARWRLATMGATPAARGTGVAVRLLDDLIERATAAGVARLELEVFAANEPACRLYRGRGFEPAFALHGYELGTDVPRPGTRSDAHVEIDPSAAFDWFDETDDQISDLPMQVTRCALSATPGPLRAWSLGSARLIFGDEGDGPVIVRALIDRDPAQRDARALLDVLVAHIGGRTIRVPQLQRLDVGGTALEHAGFARMPLHQWLMTKALSSPIG